MEASQSSVREKEVILVVDDTSENLDLMNQVLKGTYRVLAAKSGEKALQLAQQHQPDLMLLDIMMPDLDGYGTLSKLKTLQGLEDLPVIFISALGDVVAKTKGFAAGAVDYITKPIEPDEVLARVKTHLSLRKARRLLEQQNKDLILAAKLREDVEGITRHDLKSPLNAIIATAQFELENDELPEETKESMEIIAKSGLDMLQMINLSLDLFKMERGLYRFNGEAVPIKPLLLRIQKEVESLLRAGHLSLQLKQEPEQEEAFSVLAEPLLLYSLFGNLIKNALEAAPQESVVTLSLHRSPGFTVVSIRNPGEIPVAIRAKLFSKFATAGKSGGTGLGLYSSKLICKTIGAELTADSTEAQFTSVKVSFKVK